jgi:hypothetical protein
MNFPIRIRVSKQALEEFVCSEEGSWSDHDEAPDHQCAILQRHKTSIEIRNAEEAAKVYYACCSGTFQLDYKGFLRTARRIANELREAAKQHDPDIVKHWPAPDGH